jgi:EAL domain-containing protein (putative c-di-GMP-specific phosphodiesterase class I)
MRDDFVPHIIGIVEEYGIPKSFINFEITESVSASDYELLSKVVKELKEHGFQFSMDDYGTGYSNMHSLFSLDFDIVKIDKSILWDSEKSERGQIILENCVHMIKQMKRKILVEGVETKAHIEKLQSLGVDYYQGYFFSKPINKKQLIDYCKAG